MGWNRGSELFARIAEVIETVVDDEDDRREIYTVMITAFEGFDCDTLEECTDIDYVLDELLEEAYGDTDDSDEDEEDEWPDGGREDFG